MGLIIKTNPTPGGAPAARAARGTPQTKPAAAVRQVLRRRVAPVAAAAVLAIARTAGSRWLAGAAVALASASAQAQLIDDLEFRREGDNAVLQVRFVTGVQILRSVAAASADLSTVFYRLLPTRQVLELATAERRLAAAPGHDGGTEGLPAVTVTDEPVTGRMADERRLLVRLGRARPHVVRAGRGDRSIELVFAGLGAAVQPGGAAAAAMPATPVAASGSSSGEIEHRAAEGLAQAQQALAGGQAQAAVDALAAVLDLPPNASSRAAQALIGQARQAAGDSGRARAEYEFFLRQYPTGEDAERVRAALAALSPQAAVDGAVDPAARVTTMLGGSFSSFYYGGQSRVRTQEFEDSPLSGLPQLISEATLSGTDQSQLVSQADVNWRRRDLDSDQRFVFRDTHYKDLRRPDKTRNRLTALYYDHRSTSLGTSLRVGRQTPLGGGVLERFDGVQAAYSFRPRWKAAVVAGRPADALLDARRTFYGASVEAEALTPQLGASLYLIEQKIDGQVDRRALGSEMRWFDGGLSVTGQLDHDLMLKGLNIASLQGTWQQADNSVFTFLYDHRATPMRMLGNTLFFGSVAEGVLPTRIDDLLGTGRTVEQLREQVRQTTAMSTQAALGLTTPVHPQWQAGVDLRYTRTGAIAPVPDLLPFGQPASGDIWTLGLQAIGTNLYSARDTHVLIASVVSGPAFQGQLLSYNNASTLSSEWQLEPSLRLYRQTSAGGARSTRWSPGLRTTWRVRPTVSVESELNVEQSKSHSAGRNEAATRTFYYLGARWDL